MPALQGIIASGPVTNLWNTKTLRSSQPISRTYSITRRNDSASVSASGSSTPGLCTDVGVEPSLLKQIVPLRPLFDSIERDGGLPRVRWPRIEPGLLARQEVMDQFQLSLVEVRKECDLFSFLGPGHSPHLYPSEFCRRAVVLNAVGRSIVLATKRHVGIPCLH